MKKPETKTLNPSTHKTLTRQTLIIRNFEKKRERSSSNSPHINKNTATPTRKTQMFRICHNKKNVYEVFFWVITPNFLFLPQILGLHSCQYRKHNLEISPSRFLRFDFQTNIRRLSVATSPPINNLRVSNRDRKKQNWYFSPPMIENCLSHERILLIVMKAH